MDVLGAWLRGLQTRGKGPASWFMVLVSEQMYHASMQGAPLGVIRVCSHPCRQCHVPRHTSAILCPFNAQWSSIQLVHM